MHTLSHGELALLRSVTSKSRIIDGRVLRVGRGLQREGLVALQSITPKFCHCMITPAGLRALEEMRSTQLKECLMERLAFAE